VEASRHQVRWSSSCGRDFHIRWPLVRGSTNHKEAGDDPQTENNLLLDSAMGDVSAPNLGQAVSSTILGVITDPAGGED
jgi:hypothetical protein